MRTLFQCEVFSIHFFFSLLFISLSLCSPLAHLAFITQSTTACIYYIRGIHSLFLSLNANSTSSRYKFCLQFFFSLFLFVNMKCRFFFFSLVFIRIRNNWKLHYDCGNKLLNWIWLWEINSPNPFKCRNLHIVAIFHDGVYSCRMHSIFIFFSLLFEIPSNELSMQMSTQFRFP